MFVLNTWTLICRGKQSLRNLAYRDYTHEEKLPKEKEFNLMAERQNPFTKSIEVEDYV